MTHSHNTLRGSLASAALMAATAFASPAQASLTDANFFAYTYPTGDGVAIGCKSAGGDNAIELHASRYSGVFVCGDIGDTRINEANGSLNGFILWLLLP
jgi:hypothetical protein